MQNLEQSFFKNDNFLNISLCVTCCLYLENKLQSNTSLESLWKPKIYKSLYFYFLFLCSLVEVCDEIHIIIHSRVYIEGSQI